MEWGSLLDSRFKRRHATLLPSSLWEGALRDDTKNGCVADYYGGGYYLKDGREK